MLLTIFSSCKPFSMQAKMFQTNAIQSWLRLRPEPEVILFGSEEGTAEVASRLGVRHIPDVECNEYGTPLVSSIFNMAQNIASHQIMCNVNADIVLMSDFMTAICQIQVPSFLVIGRRWDIDVKKPLDFDSPDWERQLRAHLAEAGRLHAVSALDYFIFPRGLYDNIPPFAIGRTGHDNWLVYRARISKVPVIDATGVITAVHQNHDYSHHPQGLAGVWEGPEAQRNRQLVGGYEYAFTVRDATWLLTAQGMRKISPLKVRYHHWVRLVGCRLGGWKAKIIGSVTVRRSSP